MRSRFLAAAAAAAMAACATGRAEKIPMTTMEWKGQSGPEEAGSLVAADQGAWERAWSRVGRDAPALDFAKFVGVMVFAGRRPTGGYTIVFDKPVARGDDVVVRFRVPKPGGFTTQALAQPWTARAIARPKGRVIVEAAPE